MSSLNEPAAKRIATFFRQLSSDYDQHQLEAVEAVRPLLGT